MVSIKVTFIDGISQAGQPTRLRLPTIRVRIVEEELEGCDICTRLRSDLVSDKVRKMRSDVMCHMYIRLKQCC